MAGKTVSFIADAPLAARVREIAAVDGVTQSQAAARASALGALLPPAARKMLRLILEEGGEAAKRDLAASVARSIAQVGNAVLERQMRARATPDGKSEEELASLSVTAVAASRDVTN